MSRVHHCQQGDVSGRVPSGKTVAGRGIGCDYPGAPVFVNEPGHLSVRVAGHGFKVRLENGPIPLAQPVVAETVDCLCNPGILLGPAGAPERNVPADLYERLKLGDTDEVGVVHMDGHTPPVYGTTPARFPLRPSFRVHYAVESDTHLGLMLYCTRLTIDKKY